MIATTSTIDELIKSKNPFAGHIVVRPPQIWGKSFPDVPLINAHASKAVFDAVENIRNGKRDTIGITITSEKGLGKSHIISRIRHKLQVEDGTLFVYMSKYDNLNQIKYQFLQTIASSLRAFGSKKVMQWQEIAAALINEVKNWNYTPEQYISLYPNWLSKYSTKAIEHLTELVLQIKPEITNPYIVKAILWTLSTVHANYATYWLSGLELTEAQAEAMGLPNHKNEDKETESLSMVRQILDITSHYRIPVICFDEVDTAADISDTGFTAAQLIANLVKDLYNSLKRGVLLLAIYPETWNEQIRALPQAEAVIDRLASEQSDRQPLTLRYLNADDIVAVVHRWLQDFYQDNQLTPPHNLYPFDEVKLRDLGRSKPTIRSLLKWCADNFVTINPGIEPPEEKERDLSIEACFQSELINVEASIDDLLEDEAEISYALWLAFNSLIGETLEGVTIEAIEKVPNQEHIDFKIIGNQKKVKIGVDVIQQTGGAYVTAALSKLIDYRKYHLTRGCLVRSKKINKGAALAKAHLQKLLQKLGGEWVSLQAKDIKPLLAIALVYYNHKSYDLTKEQVLDFIKQKKLAINNPLVREIISDPSGQEPDNLTDDDLPMRIPQSVATTDNVELTL